MLIGVGNITVLHFKQMCQYLDGNTPWIVILKVALSVFMGKITENESRFKLLAEVRKLKRSNNFRDLVIEKM